MVQHVVNGKYIVHVENALLGMWEIYGEMFHGIW